MDEILPLLAIRADERVENTNRSRVGSVAATASMSAFERGQHGMEQHFVHTYLALRDLTLETNLIGRASSLSSLLMHFRILQMLPEVRDTEDHCRTVQR